MPEHETRAGDRPIWLITGASGMLGGHVGRWLAGRAHRIGWSRTGGPEGAFDTLQVVDLEDDAEVHRVMAQVRPHVVVHTAALASHERCEADPQAARRLNAEIAGTTARAARAVGARFIHISTDAVFDGEAGNFAEDAQTNPFSVYGETKLLGEHLVLEADPSALVVRTNFFGWSPSGSRSILEFFVNNLRSGTRVRGYDDFVVTSIYGTHLAEALWDLQPTQARGILHVASSDALSKFDFGRNVASAFHLDAGLIERSSADAGNHATSRARNLSLDTSQAAALLGHPLPTQADGLLLAADEEPRRS